MATTELLTPRQRLAQLSGRNHAAPGVPSPSATPSPAAASPKASPEQGRPYLVVNTTQAASPTPNIFETIRKYNTLKGRKAMPADIKNAASAGEGAPSAQAPEAAVKSPRERMRESIKASLAALRTGQEIPNAGDYDHTLGNEGSADEYEGDGQAPAAHTSTVLVTAVATAVASKPLSLRDRLRAGASAPPPGMADNYEAFAGTAENGSSAASSREVDYEEITGTLSSFKEFNGWAVGTLWTQERKEYRVTGESLAGLTEGLEYTFKGRHTDHAQYGPGFDVVSARPAISPNDKSIEHYMVRSFKGIGDAKAAKYIKSVRAEGGDEAVERLRQMLLTAPWELDLSKVAKGAKFNEEEDPQGAMKQLMVTRNLTLNLGGKGGLKESTAKLLAAYLISEVTPKPKAVPDGEAQPALTALGAGDVVTLTWSTLMLNPYAPIHDVPGYGFGLAESIASVAGVPKDSPLRLGALTEYAVEEGCKRRGHTFLRTPDFVEAIRRVDPTAPAQQALIHAIQQELVVIDNKRVYPSRLLTAEVDVAERLAKLMEPATPLTKRSAAAIYSKLEKEPEKINPAFKDGFDEQQKAAIANIMTGTQRLHVLTGGPGTGKTAIMEVLLTLLKKKSFIFCGPTGKSAKVLAGRVNKFGYAASTVNSILKGAEESGFEVNEEDPLDCDILVVDENTMNGIGMASGILAAMPPDAHLIFLGDPGLPAKPQAPGSARAGQLPSISPGRFMQDLLQLPGVQHSHLSHTYRNSGGILEVVNEVACGALNTTDRECVKFSHNLPEPSAGFPLVMQEYLGKVEQGGFESTFLVMPVRKGDRATPGWNTTYANHVLRNACNPYGQKLPGTQLHLGDRIMVRENMSIAQPKASELGNVMQSPDHPSAPAAPPKKSAANFGGDVEAFFESDDDDDKKIVKRVVNGDTGTIIAYAMGNATKQMGSPRWIRLALDDGQIVEFPGSDAASLDHAYAGTVHAAQGSEFKNVIMVVTPGTPEFMHQNMLFTGLSRPREHLSVWGDDRAIKKIAATVMPERNSGLVERVKQHLAEAESPNPSAEEAVEDGVSF